jgi:peptidoglycan hydrolase CwlO-like protein
VELKQAYVPFAVALAVVAGLMGCKDDSAAVSALEELTTELSMEVKDQNETLTNLSAEIQTCMKDLAETKGEAVVITSKSVEVDVPSLEGEATVESLGALKAALKETVTEQKTAIDELAETKAQCDKDLEAARAEAEAAAAAEAEAAAAAAKAAPKRKAAAKKKAVEESEAGQQREAEGRPATGLGSRHKKR